MPGIKRSIEGGVSGRHAAHLGGWVCLFLRRRSVKTRRGGDREGEEAKDVQPVTLFQNTPRGKLQES